MKFTKRFNELLKIYGKTQVEIAKAINLTKRSFCFANIWKFLPIICLGCLRIIDFYKRSLQSTPYGVKAQNCVLLFESVFFVGVAHTHKGIIPLTLIKSFPHFAFCIMHYAL
jgi:hypothetical protein